MEDNTRINSRDFPLPRHRYFLLFVIFMIICFGLGYATLGRYDPRDTGDPNAYYQMAAFDYAGAGAPFRFRVLTPTFAGLVLPVFLRFRPGTWDPVSFSFLLINSLFTSLTALILFNIARILKPERPAIAIISPFVFLSSFMVVNEHLIGLVDAGEAFFITGLILALFRNRWFLAPILISLGAVNKETTAVFGVIYLITWLVLQRFPEVKQQRIAFLCLLLSICVSLILMYVVRTLIGGQTYAAHTLSVSRFPNMLPSLIISLSSKSLLYGFVFLLPIGILRLKELPKQFVTASFGMGFAAMLLGVYAEVGENISRPLFNTTGPMLVISCAIFLRDFLGREQENKT